MSLGVIPRYNKDRSPRESSALKHFTPGAFRQKMNKKKIIDGKPVPTFEVRLIGPDLSPEKVPLRAVGDVLAAVQNLASGRDPFEQKPVPHEKGIGLVKVLRGSAVYCCLSRSPTEAVDNLARIGRLLASPDAEEAQGNAMIAALKPIQSLSEIAKSVKCRITVTATSAKKPLFSINEDDFQRIAGRLFVSGDTTIYGQIKRVGGATGMRCLMRIPGRHHILYCDVKSRDLVRRLGQHLYEDIAATGTAEWIQRTWMIYSFTLKDFTQPKIQENTPQIIEELRNAGLSAWDNVESPELLIRELRS
jgi:hypothetical protein